MSMGVAHRLAVADTSTGLARLRRGLAAVAVVLSIAAVIAMTLAPQYPGSARLLPDWIAAPAQLLALVSTSTLVWQGRHERGSALAIWVLVQGYCLVSLVASCVWNLWRPLAKIPSLTFADAIYFLDYALLTAVYGAAYLRFGGSFRDRHTWLDALTIVVALLGTFWGTLLEPSLHGGVRPHVEVPYALSYAVVLSLCMSMAALLYMRLPAIRAIPLLLICAGLIEAVWELGWLATWLTDHNYVGLFYNVGDLLCFTLVACAAAVPVEWSSPGRLAFAERSAHAFVPTLSALLAVGFVGVSLASTRAPDAWILGSLVILTGLLLISRQAAARRRLADLTRELAIRAADARVTELVRQSADAFLVIDTRGLIAFASPATQAMLGASAAGMIGTDARQLFEPEQRTPFERFLRRLMQEAAPAASIELPFKASHERPRVLRLRGANCTANPHIDGITLTISDISDQRALQRDVLAAVNHERLRLAGDIHDGLGQELSGIALMLQGLSASRELGAAAGREELRAIAEQLGEAIRGARDLAHGLSPIYVVRGSLREALMRLAADIGNQPPINVAIDARIDELVIDELPADHLYRIAREAVQNAVRHAACSRIDVRLRVLDGCLELDVADDGVGIGGRPGRDYGLGIRLMEYRAHVVGGTFELAPATHGTIVRVRVSLADVLRAESAPRSNGALT